jgi:hypothetical protein
MHHSHGHGHGHGLFILATYPKGIWTTNPNPLACVCVKIGCLISWSDDCERTTRRVLQTSEITVLGEVFNPRLVTDYQQDAT